MTATAQGSTRPAAWLVVLVAGAVAAGAVAVLPLGDSAGPLILVAAEIAALVAVAWRFRSTPPLPALPWLVFLAAISLCIVADATGAFLGDAVRWSTARPALDLLYVVAYAMLAAGIALAARSRGAGHDPGEIVDALIVTAAAGVALFALILGVHLEVSAPLWDAARLGAVVVAGLGVAMVGLGTLLFIRLGRLTTAVGLFTAALALNLVAETLYADGVFGQMAVPRGAANSFAIMAWACFAAAAVHPTIVDVLRVRPGTAPLSARTRLAFITGAAVLASLAGIAGQVAGQVVGEDAAVDVVTDILVVVIVALFAVRAWMLATEVGHAEARLARTSTDLERTSALVEGISEAMPGALFAGDLATLTLDYASPGLQTLIGVDPASALGKPGWIVERLHPDDREGFAARSREAHAAGRASQSFENRMRTEDGSYRYVASTVRYVAGPGGTVDRFVGVGIDVTDRVAAEAELGATRRFAEEIVATSPGIVFRGRLQPAVLDFVSLGVQALLGYAPEDVVGSDRWLTGHMHPDDVEPHLDAVRETLARGGGEMTRVVRIAASDGTYRSLLYTARITVGADGSARYVASAIDVTEQQELEARLRERERFIADVARTSAGIIFAGRADTDTIEFVSPSVERVLGYAPEELIGVPGLFQGLMHPDDTALRIAQREETVTSPASGAEASGAVRRVRGKDGTYRSLVIATRVMLDQDGIARYVSSAMDISDRIELEEDLRAARDSAESASRAKTEFLSLVSHELRTPLNAILGFGELLQRADLAGEDRESVMYIMDAGRNLLRLIDRILDFVRLESGRLRPDIGPVVPAGIIRQAIAHARAAPAGRVAIEDRTEEHADLVCSGDARRLGPIIDGLLDNAISHGGPGVTVTVALDPAPDGGARIVVSDDGIGMTDEQVADALAPLSRNGIGTGVALGLSLAQRLVEAMGGELELRSRAGVGTTVTVTLPPFVDAPAPDAPDTFGAGAAPALRMIGVAADDVAAQQASPVGGGTRTVGGSGG